MHKARLVRSRPLTRNITTFWFEPEQRLDLIAGQFIELSLPHDTADQRGQRRWFTVSSSPDDKLIAITTRLTGGRGSSFKRALEASGLATDNSAAHSQTPTAAPLEVLISDPLGDFVLPRSTDIPLIFVAGGIGITPFMSMLAWLAHHPEEKRQIQLIHAVRTTSETTEHFFRDSTSWDVPEAITTVVEQAADGWDGPTGTLSADRITELAPATTETMYYISGPEPMVRSLQAGLTAKGIDASQLVTDAFLGYDAT